MGVYSIKDLENLSGIKAHTIRIWEKRYQLIRPKRTDTNIRFYDDDDLKMILNVSILNQTGLKISRIVALSGAEVREKVLEITSRQDNRSAEIDSLVIAMIELNEAHFEKLFAGFILKYGFEKTMLELIYPFLEKIGILWQTGNINPAHEHFISNLIRQKILVAIDGLPVASNPPEKSFALFLQEGELHEIGLLFYNYLIRKEGFSTFYLGQSVPMNDLFAVLEAKPSKYLVTAIVSPQHEDILKQNIDALAAKFKDKEILVSGNQVVNIGLVGKENIHVFRDVIDLQSFIHKIV